MNTVLISSCLRDAPHINMSTELLRDCGRLQVYGEHKQSGRKHLSSNIMDDGLDHVSRDCRDK